MTASPAELVAAAPVPDGWHLTVTERRRYKFRSLWRVEAVHNGVARLRWDVYRVGAALPAICERVAVEALNDSMRVLVEIDGEGYVRSIEEKA